MQAGLKTILVCNKVDLVTQDEREEFCSIYKNSGVDIIFTSTYNDEGLEELYRKLECKISVFSGVSGAGKSSLLNKFSKDLNMQTGDISKKLGRGKHTTRHSELIIVDKDTFICDTPGFSSFALKDVSPEELCDYYSDFYEFSPCKFNTCIHINEPNCKVKEALENGFINKIRYENYIYIYNEIVKNNKKSAKR